MVMVEHNTPSRKILFLWIQGVSPDCGNVENYLCVALNPHQDAEVPISTRVASLWRTLWADDNDVTTTSSYALCCQTLDVVLSVVSRRSGMVLIRLSRVRPYDHTMSGC